MPDFTPGPWRVETRYMSEEGYEQYIKSQKIIKRENDVAYTIAKINWCNPVESNAPLIASAPDMYEALDKVETFLIGTGLNGEELELLKIVQGALEKALGK